MIKINSFAVAVDVGIIQPLQKGLKSKITAFDSAIDTGIIPPKNFFHSKIKSFGVTVDIEEFTEMAVIWYQIH